LLEFLAVVSTVTFAAAAAWGLVRPYRPLRDRVRPYATMARVRLMRPADVRGMAQAGPAFGDATFRRLFGPIVDRVLTSFGRLVATSNTERLMLRLRQAGLYPDLGEMERVQEFRARSFMRTVGFAAGFGLVGLLLQGALYMVVFGAGGFLFGVLNARGRIDKAVAARTERMRGELYTINQLIAMRTRVGGGVVDAIRHVVIRGHGAFVDELAEVLRLHESGVPLGAALERAARLTPEPEAARTYAVLATAQDRGADLGEALLDLSRDLRAARREELQREASRRRLLLVIPIVVILAPIVLLFIGAPIPQIIFGGT
jgi:Flp pilus assembly protein TadB